MSNPWAVPAGTIDFYQSSTDMRVEMHNVLFGSPDVPPQGRWFILRELTDTTCTACWSPDGGTHRANCPYCDGEGYQFRERMIVMALFYGVAPVYKPSVLGTGQYPAAQWGYTDPDRATAYAEWSTWPNYERYTLPDNSAPDKLFEVKTDSNGQAMRDIAKKSPIRVAKWKMLSITPITGDGGRVEYFEIGLDKEVIA